MSSSSDNRRKIVFTTLCYFSVKIVYYLLSFFLSRSFQYGEKWPRILGAIFTGGVDFPTILGRPKFLGKSKRLKPVFFAAFFPSVLTLGFDHGFVCEINVFPERESVFEYEIFRERSVFSLVCIVYY